MLMDFVNFFHKPRKTDLYSVLLTTKLQDCFYRQQRKGCILFYQLISIMYCNILLTLLAVQMIVLVKF